MKTLVVALGGNAFLKPGQKGTAREQMKNIENVMEHVVGLLKKGYRLVLTFGNGPQVGNILLQQEKASMFVPKMPLYVCVAESQGMMGYMIQETLYNKLHKHRIDIPVITFVTQVVVDRKDPAFRKPSKPIGPFYRSKAGLPRDWSLVKTSRGFRRLVPSPEPKKIVEAEAIRETIRRAIVIVCGGGGIPVIKKKGLVGVDAVIDKDLSAELLAGVVNAEMLIMLTDVDAVYLNYGKKGAKRVRKMNIREAKQYLKEGQFPPGSMGPKIEASIRFLQARGKRVVITDFDSLEKALAGRAGTVVVRK